MCEGKKQKDPSQILIFFRLIYSLFQVCLSLCGADKGGICKVLKVF